MLLTVFGVPTATAARGLQIVESFFAVMVGDFDFLTAATMEELRSAWAGITHPHVIYYSEAPAADVVSFFRQAQAPMLVFVDDPVEVAMALQLERGFSRIQSARAVSIHVSVLEEAWLASDVMLINAGRDGTLSFKEFVRSLAAFLALSCSDEKILEVEQRLAQSGVSVFGSDLPWVRLFSDEIASIDCQATSAREREVLHRYLRSYRLVATQHPLSMVSWCEELFVSMDHGGANLSGMLDMTGRQRHLIDGPWFGLPRGRWRATIEFEVSDNFMGCLLQVNVLAGRVLRQGRITLPECGSHTCTLVFDHEDANLPVVVQFTLDRGVLQGGFRLFNVTLQKLPSRRVGDFDSYYLS